MSAQAALARAVALLRAAGVEAAAGDAKRLLAHALGLSFDRVNLILHDPMPEGAEARLEALVAARAARQPMAQILGERLFWGRSFKVTPDTLDPRPETEILVAEAIASPFSHMLDLGTGTGCILISCLLAMPGARGLGVDLSPGALEVARFNAARHAARADLALSDWFSAVTGVFDLIVSNPPYIAAWEMPDLAPEVRDHEPHLALSPGGDGLDPYRVIAAAAPRHLQPGGRILLEIGPTQGEAVSGFLAAAGFARIRILPDLDGRARVVSAVRPG